MPENFPQTAQRTFLLLLLLLGASWTGCHGCDEPLKPAGPPPLVLRLAYGSEKKTWLEEQVAAFHSSSPRTQTGRLIHIEARAMGSGEATEALLDGSFQAHVYSPASGAYLTLLNDAWLNAHHADPLVTKSEPLLLSPVVVALWKPMAEALGWPEKKLGWKDLLEVVNAPGGWAARGHPEWGSFKFGHTHPEFSNSGLLAVLAEAYAASHKTRGLTEKDLSAKATQSFVANIEQSVVHYGKSTGFFADKMIARGPGYLSASVLYENSVVESYQHPGAEPLVCIYPREGTFWADHPYAVLDAPWVGAEEREAAQAFLAFLKAKPAQARALALGFRPGEASIAMGPPLDAEHGADPKQPQTLLEVPDAPVLNGLLELWRKQKRPSDVVLVMDVSGSMSGLPLTQAKAGALSFLQGLQDADQVTLILFNDRLVSTTGPLALDADGRETLRAQVESAKAFGGTALYDAMLEAHRLASTHAETDHSRIHAVLVMTDGRDENSEQTFPTVQAALTRASATSSVPVFTIAYGSQADTRVLSQLAEAAQGSSAQGTERSIVQVYQDMASFF